MNEITYQKTLEETLREIAELEARLERLKRTAKALRELTKWPTGASRLILPPDLKITGKRAPKYFMEDTLLKKIFKDGLWLSNANVREALREMDYPFLIDNHQLRKTLSRLRVAGQLQVKHERGYAFFSLPPKKKN